MNEIALTGVPRGGTTLACRLLGECRDVVALAEPIEIDSLPSERRAAIASIQAFYAWTRRDLESTGRAPGKLIAGETGDNFFADADGNARRKPIAERGQLILNPPPPPGFALAIKHNAGFAALLPELANAIPTIALIRHPLPVLASWQTVELPVGDGRIPAGERFDPALHARLLSTPDVLSRQLVVLDWFFARFAESVPIPRIVKYEDMIASGGLRLFEAAGIAGTPRDLRDRNASALYRAQDPARLAAALRDFGGAWTGFYSAQDDAIALRRLQETA